MRSTGVHHVDLVVSSIERSLPFYRDLLAPLGYHGISEVEGERGETIYYLWGPGSIDRPARGADEGRRARTTGTRSGCTTSRSRRSSRAAVDERARWLGEAGAEIESGPQRIRVPARVLRGVLLRPGRDQARDRPHPTTRSLKGAPWTGRTCRRTSRACRFPATPSSDLPHRRHHRLARLLDRRRPRSARLGRLREVDDERVPHLARDREGVARARAVARRSAR